MRIGVIGPPNRLVMLKRVSEEFSDVSFDMFEYVLPSEAPGIVQKHQDALDAVFFSGHLPYALSLNAVHRSKPWGYLSFYSSGILPALLEARRYTLSRFRTSVDTLAEKELWGELDGSSLEIDAIYTHSKGIFRFDIDEVVDFHRTLIAEKKTDFSLTCVEAVHERLMKLGIPSYLVTPNRYFMRESLEKIILEVRGKSSEHLLSVVGIYRLVGSSKNRSWYENAMLALNGHLVEFAKRRRIMVIPRDMSSFQTIETMGQFLVGTSNFADCSFISKLRSLCDFEISIGFGAGASLSIAEEKALEALDMAGERRDVCYLFDGKEARELGNPNAGVLKFAFPDREMLLLAERLGVNASTLSRYLRALSCFDGVFTASDFGKMVGIQSKSSRKIVRMLLREKLIVESGTLSRASRGRPQALYVFARDADALRSSSHQSMPGR